MRAAPFDRLKTIGFEGFAGACNIVPGFEKQFKIRSLLESRGKTSQSRSAPKPVWRNGRRTGLKILGP